MQKKGILEQITRKHRPLNIRLMISEFSTSNKAPDTQYLSIVHKSVLHTGITLSSILECGMAGVFSFATVFPESRQSGETSIRNNGTNISITAKRNLLVGF